MQDDERALRTALGIPDSYSSVLILEQSAHCDWDWLVTFEQYYGDPHNGQHQPVRETLREALRYISQGIEAGLPYTYVFCEVAYLQAFMDDPDVAQHDKDQLKQYAGKNFFFASGGITSAENLLVHPEAFIRNYLLGRQWLAATFGATAANGAVSNQMWIPDDFGHDAQLPSLLEAMGFTGAGFWRIPAQCGVYNNTCPEAKGRPHAPSHYLPKQVGLDFMWIANDRSAVQAHWLSEGYCQGNALSSGNSIGSGWQTTIANFIAQNTTDVMPTPYMFTPIDCDFAAPYDNGPSIYDQWNAQTNESTYVVQATFDDFMKLVAAATSVSGGAASSLASLTAHPSPSSSLPPYIPNPYYSGCYASKPYLKMKHYETVRLLLMTESMQLLLRAIGSSVADQAATQLETAWSQLAPSTHHDYITGTSPNGTCGQGGNVYEDEQVADLDEAFASAEAVTNLVLTTLAGNASSTNASVLVFNGLGFDRWVNVPLPVPPPGGPYLSTYIDGRFYYPVQGDGNGGLILQAHVPALGYTTVQLSTRAPNVPPPVSATPNSDGSVTMTNGWITAVIDGTGILSLQTAQGVNCFPNAPGNQLRQFVDGGNIYRFGNEIPCSPTSFYWNQRATWVPDPISCSGGPLIATAVVTGKLGGVPYTIRYELEDRARALRISVTGAAPTSTSIMAYFEFATAPVSLTYGTTANWDNQVPRNFFDWKPPSDVELMTFEPTHDYVAAVDATGTLAGAIYHSATPAWGIYGSGIVGCLLRNTPGGQNAACAYDDGTYTITYAVEPPTVLESPLNGAGPTSMIHEALSLHSPAIALAATGTGALPAQLTIATLSDDRAIITAAKAGTVNPSQLVLRLYQPTTQALNDVTVTVASLVATGYQSGGRLAAAVVNALEQPPATPVQVSTTATSVTLDLPFAITTLALGAAG
jgi:alpha-mannosidase